MSTTTRFTSWTGLGPCDDQDAGVPAVPRPGNPRRAAPAVPAIFVDAEIDRYIALPGQALGYLIGQREILRLRNEARARLGAAYDIRDFHSAILDHGFVPLTVLRQAVEAWLASAAAT